MMRPRRGVPSGITLLPGDDGFLNLLGGVRRRHGPEQDRILGLEIGRDDLLRERLVARQRRGRMRDLVVDTIDGERASASRWADALRDAGFKGMGTGLRYYAGLQS